MVNGGHLWRKSFILTEEVWSIWWNFSSIMKNNNEKSDLRVSQQTFISNDRFFIMP